MEGFLHEMHFFGSKDRRFTGFSEFAQKYHVLIDRNLFLTSLPYCRKGDSRFPSTMLPCDHSGRLCIQQVERKAPFKDFLKNRRWKIWSIKLSRWVVRQNKSVSKLLDTISSFGFWPAFRPIQTRCWNIPLIHFWYDERSDLVQAWTPFAPQSRSIKTNTADFSLAWCSAVPSPVGIEAPLLQIRVLLSKFSRQNN